MGSFIIANAAWISLAPAAVWAGLFFCMQMMTAHSPDAARPRRPARISPVAWIGSAMLCMAWVVAVLAITQLPGG